MKANYLLVGLSLLTGCAQSPQQQAEAAVSQYIKTSLNDPESYKPGGFLVQPFSRADSARLEGNKINKALDENHSKFFAANNSADRQQLLAHQRELAAHQLALIDIQDTARAGWRIYHDYRAKNQYNALVKQQGSFAVYGQVVVPLND